MNYFIHNNLKKLSIQVLNKKCRAITIKLDIHKLINSQKYVT